ncbi:MAG TPA: dienelactone hydrolase family protein [Acidobacteriaceae bacterium]|nr:dienelactone hydrolase family protein [Acidobacteriaceae bacterium]
MNRGNLFPALLVVGMLAAGSPARAQIAQQVGWSSGTETVHGLLYLPSGSGVHPALVVIHEWWGLTDWVKDQAQDFARQGYVTLAVDLYSGQVTNNPNTAYQLMSGLSQERSIENLTGAVAFLSRRRDVDPHRIGAVGWCMGGGYAAQLAIADPNLRAVVINYGELPTDRTSLERIHAAVLGNFGGLDQGITPADVHAFAASMQSLGKSIDVKIYPDAGHAFQNPDNKTGYRPADTANAKARERKFLAQELKPGM